MWHIYRPMPGLPLSHSKSGYSHGVCTESPTQQPTFLLFKHIQPFFVFLQSFQRCMVPLIPQRAICDLFFFRGALMLSLCQPLLLTQPSSCEVSQYLCLIRVWKTVNLSHQLLHRVLCRGQPQKRCLIIFNRLRHSYNFIFLIFILVDALFSLSTPLNRAYFYFWVYLYKSRLRLPSDCTKMINGEDLEMDPKKDQKPVNDLFKYELK